MNMWKCFKKLWYFLIGKEYKVKIGWVLLPPQAVILNNEFIYQITIDKRK